MKTITEHQFYVSYGLFLAAKDYSLMTAIFNDKVVKKLDIENFSHISDEIYSDQKKYSIDDFKEILKKENIIIK